MPRKKKTETEAAENLSYVKQPEFPFLYANNAVINMGELDASIIFGEIVGRDEQGQAIVVPKAKVIMALPFILKLQELLSGPMVRAHFEKLMSGSAKAD